MGKAKVWEETVYIPTYPVGEPEKNPMFIEKRVYQGSSGKVYPYPTIEKIGDTKEDKPYRAVFLENEYLKVCVLPELGGRIQRAYDKTNGYDFVYYNHVIKPALVGLLGPWISGGIEFNWPQHHRPTTFMPVDYVLQNNKDGSASVLLSDTDRIYGTKGSCKITLYPGVSYIEIKGQLYNRTSLPQTFLWWANPAVPVNENTQTIMPPDVHAVMDHGKRDVSRWPIATGTYYKKDYSEGVDISRYKNIPVPTSLMAAKSSYDFVGGYDYGKEAGILHVADHHVSPGKKQWTWGCGDFGKAWDRNLTDEDGPYVELMTGVFTDNQPDFTWLKPFEEKTFTQYFMPYKKVGVVKNATKDACLGMEKEDGGIRVCVYATREVKHAAITVKENDNLLLHEETDLSPEKPYEKLISGDFKEEDHAYSIRVSENGRILVSYRPEKESIPEIPDPAKAAEEPAKIQTNEELYLTGQHLEQYRHATYLPDPYYFEGLKRDPGDSRINCAYGMLLFRRGRADLAEQYFRSAVKRLTERNPNPYNSEAYYDLGLCLLFLGKEDEAYDAFFKATWSAEQQNMAFYYLAVIDMRRGRYEHALEMLERSLVRNSENIRARALKAVALRKAGYPDEAKAWLRENLTVDPFDYVSAYEAEKTDAGIMDEKELARRDRKDTWNLLHAAQDLGLAGCFEEAMSVLEDADTKSPMVHYYRSFFEGRLGKTEDAVKEAEEAEKQDPYCCFPNELWDIRVLEHAIRIRPASAKAMYYLGNLYYDKLQWERAVDLWEKSEALDNTFPTVLRNLSLAYYNKLHDPDRALEALEKAYTLDPPDARVFFELDQLHKKMGWTFGKRLQNFEDHMDNVLKRDDLCVEYVTLLNSTGNYEKAYQFMMNRRFHPWEGGEGKITTQYEFSLLMMALDEMTDSNWKDAKEHLEKALTYPRNLGEGKLEGTKDNHIHYYIGVCDQHLGKDKEAEDEFATATKGTDEPAGMMYYNDQPADMILFQGLSFRKLGKKGDANRRFYRLVDYGERHIREDVKIGYFAVSLPDFLTFEDDLTQKNRAHCCFLMAMGYAGLGDKARAEKYISDAVRLDPANFRMSLLKTIMEETGLL